MPNTAERGKLQFSISIPLPWSKCILSFFLDGTAGMLLASTSEKLQTLTEISMQRQIGCIQDRDWAILREVTSHTPYRSIDRSNLCWVLWWAMWALAPLLFSCLDVSLINDSPWEKETENKNILQLEAKQLVLLPDMDNSQTKTERCKPAALEAFAAARVIVHSHLTAEGKCGLARSHFQFP